MSTSTMAALTRNRFMETSSLMNAMLVFLPLAILGEHFGLGGVFVFVAAALSCLPLSYWLGQATEALGARLGPVSGGLLNATFGNNAPATTNLPSLTDRR